jgi:hypothetical protein
MIRSMVRFGALVSFVVSLGASALVIPSLYVHDLYECFYFVHDDTRTALRKVRVFSDSGVLGVMVEDHWGDNSPPGATGSPPGCQGGAEVHPNK